MFILAIVRKLKNLSREEKDIFVPEKQKTTCIFPF